MKIVSWNVQNGLDAYGSLKLPEQYAYLLEQDADVIALQEVDSLYMAEIEQALHKYQWHFAPALTFYEEGVMKQFGNAIGAKKGSIIQWRSHCLLPTSTYAPQHMPRSVGEMVVETGSAPIRVLSCHLEFYCARQRQYQIEQMDKIVEAAVILQESPSGATEGLYRPLSLPVETVICGDFNIPDLCDEYHQRFYARSHWRDLGLTTLQPTCGVFDTLQWEEGPDRRDYFFTNSSRIKGRVETDTLTSLSDHQPIALYLELYDNKN